MRFTVLTAAESGLPSDRIRTVVRGADDALWLATDQNLLARLRNGVVTVFGTDRGLPDRAVRTAHVDRGGGVWAMRDPR